ncbi:ABC transporter substrate-binding protein [Phytohabitans kaempferiae]|uniref:ABC transporter substrate-binding protein n=1 Tax=Phytohabitans kaempferiae TaxID=1620943 RepID=A0ABV6MBJ2_9ACTN
MAVAAISVALVATTAACGSDDDSSGSEGGGQVTLAFTWWGDPNRAKVTQDAVAAFERKNPNIKVTTTYTGYADYFTKLATQTAGGDAPDVFQMDYRYLSEYGSRGVLADLDQTGQGTLDLANVPEVLADTGKWDGKRYAIPFGQTTGVVVYDKAFFTSAGINPPEASWTWDAFGALAGQLSAKGGGKVAGSVDASYLEDGFEIWLRQQGKALYNAEGKLAFTEADLVQWWDLWAKLRASKAVTEPTVTVPGATGDVTKNGLIRKVAAMDFGTSSNASAYGTDIGLINYPGEAAKAGQYIKPSMLLSAYARGKHPKEAAALINFLINDPDAGKILGVSRGVPPNSTIAQSISSSLKPIDQQILAYITEMTPKVGPPPVPPPAGDGQIQQLLVRITQDVWFGRQQPAAAAKAFFSQAETELQ